MMGCIGSRLGHLSGLVSHSSSSDAHYHSTSVANGGDGIHSGGGGGSGSGSGGNVFPVLNVDDLGRHISPGKLEVTETELILYIQAKTPLNWPLRCLRRYGYENDLFSFESGRRCPTGPGIYAFKCTRAQSLFNLLQAKIQNNPASNITLPPPQLHSTTPATTEGGGGGEGGLGDESPSSTPGSVSPTFDYVNIAENSQLLRGSAVASPESAPVDGDSSHPLYMNVESKGKGKEGRKVRSGRLCNGGTPLSSVYQNDYLNYHSAAKVLAGAHVQTNPHSSVLYTNVSCSSEPPAKREEAAPTAEINYAELDLKQVPNSKPSQPMNARSVNGTSQRLVISQSFSSDGQPPPHHDPPAAAPHTNSSSTTNHPSTTTTTLSYAVLQPPTNQSSSSSSGPFQLQPHQQHHPTPSELGYATIDFDRTAALSIVTRSKIKLNFSHSSSTDKEDDEASSSQHAHARKTRHNSTAL